MNRKVAPALNLENRTCVIRCCAYPSSTADEGDRGDEDNVKDGDVTRMTDRIPVLLRKIYTDLKNPASFSSPYRLYAEAKKINSKIKLQDVMDWLETQKSYILHQQIKTKFSRRKVLTRGYNTNIKRIWSIIRN